MLFVILSRFSLSVPCVSSSYGSVYKAMDKRDGKLVAIKVLEVENEDTVELQKEINILKECDCEYIVRYKGSYRKDGNIWIVMVRDNRNRNSTHSAISNHRKERASGGRRARPLLASRDCHAHPAVPLPSA